MWKWRGLFLAKNFVLRCLGWLSLLGSFFLLRLLSISINLLYTHAGHKWNTVATSGLVPLDKLQKWICRTVGPSLAAFLEPLGHWGNVTGLSLLYKYYFGRCSSEVAQLVPLLISRGRSTRYFSRLHDFSVIIPRCHKDVYVNSFFPCTARLWNSLCIEWISLTFNLNGFKSRINRHLLTVGSF